MEREAALEGGGEVEELARRARAGEPAARNALWARSADTVGRAVERQRLLPRLWEREDLHQEAFIVFAAVVDEWPGGPFAAYMERAYPVRLGNHVRRILRKQARERSVPVPLDAGSDPLSTAGFGLAELLEGVRSLPERERAALRLHILNGLPLGEVGRRLGLGRRALGELVPLARRAIVALESEEARLERLVREMYEFADAEGRLRGTGREIRARLGLPARAHAALCAELEERGVLTGRSRGHAGSLPAEGPDAAVRLLRAGRRPRSA